jgi:hypothetical protein
MSTPTTNSELKVQRLEAQLAKAETALEAATGEHTSADAHADAVTPGGLTGYDSAILSGIRRKASPRRDEQRFNAYSRAADAQRKLDDLRNEVRRLQNRLDAARKEATRIPFTRDQLTGAVLVKSETYGWCKVRKVNQKTVSVDSGYSWADLIPIGQILEYRTAVQA